MLLSQESRVKLQSLINHPEIHSVSIHDGKYAHGIRTSATIHADCEVFTLLSILDAEAIEFNEPREFECDHESSVSLGHTFEGKIEGCTIDIFATRKVKKEAPQQEGAKENTLSDYTPEMEVVANA